MTRIIPTVIALMLGACKFVPANEPSAPGASAVATIIPASVHLENGHLYAQAFVQVSTKEGDAGVSMSLEGPGATPGDVAHVCDVIDQNDDSMRLDCRPYDHVQIDMFEPRFSPYTFNAVDPAALTTGPYTLEVAVRGRVVAHHVFSLAKVATVGGQTTYVVAPQARPNTLVFDGRRAFAWVRVDGRAHGGDHRMRFAWVQNGKVAHVQVAKFQPPYLRHDVWDRQGAIALDAAVVDVQLFALEAPKAGLEGTWSIIALLDGTVPVASWELTAASGALSAPESATAVTFGQLTGTDNDANTLDPGQRPIGFVTGRASAPAALVGRTRSHDGIGSDPTPEPNVCAFAFEPSARAMLKQSAELSARSMNEMASTAASHENEYRDLEKRAVAKGRVTDNGEYIKVTQGELDAAGRRGDRRSSGADAARAGYDRQNGLVWKKLDGLARKYKPGCLAAGLGKLGTTLPD